MKFANTEVWGFKHALRGMRNPMNSWSKSDSQYCKLNDIYDCGTYITNNNTEDGVYVIGKNDMNLAQRLITGGTEHRKFLRQIMVSVDITAPLYFWKEFDTYKVGTIANSTSTMHKLATTPITIECFETDDMDEDLLWCPTLNCSIIDNFIPMLEELRCNYIETGDYRFWKELVRWLPESCLQTRTITMSYENLRNMYFQRKNHKLIEWSYSFTNWLNTLPYAKEFITYINNIKMENIVERGNQNF